VAPLADFVKRVSGFGALTHAEKIKHFGWYLQTERGQETFRAPDIRTCYESAHLDPPVNLPRSMNALTEKKPPDLLKRNGAYRLHANPLAELTKLYGRPESTVAVEKAVAELPVKLTSASERLFLEETLTCYRNHAFRAAIVMAWNLAYDHLLHWILKEPSRVTAFNTEVARRFAKKGYSAVAVRSDFEQMKEAEVIDAAGVLPGITDNMKRTLKEKLGRRNTYAHPSTMTVAKPQVDDMVTDLVNNIVLRLP
jgi:hypothetical protein